MPNFIKMTMYRLLTLSIIISFFSCNSSNGQKCSIPKPLEKEINQTVTKTDLNEDDFYRVNNMLFDYEFKDSLSTLKNCNCYSNNIVNLFNSSDPEKRVIAYRLIGAAQDSAFNEKLIKKITSNESSLLKTWSSTALMANKCSIASDELFKLFSSYPDGLPVDILINMYIKYDTIAVKKTCWKYINSKSKNEQIMSIQCLANLGQDKTLQKQLIEFLETWDIKSKGWVISSMGIQKMNNLKPLLEKYAKTENLKSVVIRALESSPTITDNEYAKQLEGNKN
ncbi:MAG: hypothetical protein MUC49_01230 [Raineya sp.]|jgi:hypothetical protein|nr:hypothetical protein [Raineya sp.]